MADAATADPTASRMGGRAVIAGAIGNFIEWYDYAVYGYLAGTIATLFFPAGDRLAALLSTFAVFALGFVIRPLGAVVFGHLGDRIGRRPALSAAIILMGLATFAIGVLPTYAQIGAFAPALLVLARLAQGFSAGGEWGGSAAFLVEHAPPGRRAFFGSWHQFGVVGGLLAGASFTALLPVLLGDVRSGWRIPFLVGLALAAIGLYVRLRIAETPSFRALERTGEVAHAPLREAVRGNRLATLTAFGIALLPGVAFYATLVYVPTYLVEVVGLSSGWALSATVVALVTTLLFTPVMGALSDRVGRRPMLIAAGVGYVVLTYPVFLLLAQRAFGAVLAAEVLIGLLFAVLGSVLPATLVELFPTQVRYSALSIGYNFSVAVFGGTAPFLATFLVAVTGSRASPSFLVIAGGLVSLVIAFRMRETFRAPLG
ncbi:MFS transporter [Pseudonocardia acaciae]|uniref:MFS transporter n=1 Tax=Pseudonocardia acaciae TaxID=551276 RepID=UPI000684B3B2|nr:MFS transporter [Pseudonocardia acaciae]